MTPRERAEACIGAAERVSYVVGGMTPDRSVEYSHARDFLADSAPALARDLIAALDEAEKMRAVVEAARGLTSVLDNVLNVGARQAIESVNSAWYAATEALAALDAAKGGE